MTATSRTFRYDTSSRWYKGNTHIHSSVSDGGKSLSELGDLYSAAGYDFLVATDHNIASDLNEIRPTAPLLWLDGVELDGHDESGSYYHVVCIGRLNGITRETPFPDAMKIASSCNALRILAHPFWTGSTMEDTARWEFDGVEIYNHVAHWLNGKSDGRVHWNAMLQRNSNILAFAADDAHLSPAHPGWNGGWIVVNAKERSEGVLMSAIRRGNYYSSCGPDFHTIDADGNAVHITTSSVQFARLVGPGPHGQRFGASDGQQGMTEASFQLPTEWDYAYVEIEDREGKRAWTNTLYRSAASQRSE